MNPINVVTQLDRVRAATGNDPPDGFTDEFLRAFGRFDERLLEPSIGEVLLTWRFNRWPPLGAFQEGFTKARIASSANRKAGPRNCKACDGLRHIPLYVIDQEDGRGRIQQFGIACAVCNDHHEGRVFIPPNREGEAMVILEGRGNYVTKLPGKAEDFSKRVRKAHGWTPPDPHVSKARTQARMILPKKIAWEDLPEEVRRVLGEEKPKATKKPDRPKAGPKPKPPAPAAAGDQGADFI
jgi:hypothetical protein